MKIYEITEALTPQHIRSLNRLRSEPDGKELATKIQKILAKSNISWDVAAELARTQLGKEREAQKKRKDSFTKSTTDKKSAGWDDETHGHLRTGKSKIPGVGGFEFTGNRGSKLRGQGSYGQGIKSFNKKAFGDEEPIKNFVKDKWRDVVQDPVDDVADDPTRGWGSRGTAKVARTVGSGIKGLYKGARHGKFNNS